MSGDIESLVASAVVAWRAASDGVGYEGVTDVLLAARELDPDALARCALKMLGSVAAADRAVGCDAAGLVVRSANIGEKRSRRRFLGSLTLRTTPTSCGRWSGRSRGAPTFGLFRCCAS